MMEVTQKVELNELSTGEEQLLQSIVSGLNHDEEPSMKRSNETVDKEVCNGLNVEDPDNEIEASTHLNSIDKYSGIVPSKERNAGTDLDALLDKITSIVDCNPKESADGEMEPSSLADKTVVEDFDHEDDIDTDYDCTEPKMIDGKEVNKVEEHHNCVEEVKDAKLVTTGKKIQEGSEITLNNEIFIKTDICGATTAAADSDDLDEKKAQNENCIKAAEISNMVDPAATKTKLNNSNDEVYMDALENISSSDEFEALEENNQKIQKESVEKECRYGVKAITSEDSHCKVVSSIEKTREVVSTIDLDTSEECLAEKQKSEGTKVTATHKKIDEDKNEESKKEIAVQKINEKSINKLVEATDSSESCPKETKQEKEGNEKESKVLAEANSKIVKTAESNQTLDNELKPADELSNPEDQASDKKDADSDDEVIFFEPIKKSAETKTADKGEESKVIKPSPEPDKKEDEVVLLSEDEDDLPTAEQPEEAPSINLDNAASKAKTNGFIGVDLSADNSDNACDQFEKVKMQEKAKPSTIEDVNSNSSNLLQPSQKSRGESVTVADVDADADVEAGAVLEPEPEADPNVELEDDNVEMVAEELEDEQDATPPAVKRIRLSTDHKTETCNTSSCTTNDTCSTTATTTTTTTNDEEAPQIVGKRSHSLLSNNSPSQKEETPSKKLKADESDSNSSNDGTLEIDLDAHEQTQSESETTVADVESVNPVVELDMPVKLKPKPELKCDVKSVRLEFVKSFCKSFDKMTRHDLEELVLQKVVESMLVKSEFAEIRRQVDNHEVTLSNYRRKIAEVSKQYLDLETVHKRVLKDLETKNAQFTAPVRITRAVGLQVGMTLMKKPSEESRNHHTAGSMPAPSVALGMNASPSVIPTPLKVSTSPLRSTMRPGRSITRPQSNTEQQQNLQQQQAQLTRSSQPFAQASGSSNSSPVRRGCMQKVTPHRPVNNHASQSVSNPSMPQQPRWQATQTSQTHRTPMFVSKHTGIGTSPTATAALASASAMRHRGPTAKPGTYSSMTHKLQQQQQQPCPVRIGRSPGKQQQSAVSVTCKQRLAPIGGGTVSVPMLNTQEIGAGAAGYGQPSLTPARPKEKAVIDLTDEDDAAAAAAAAVVAAAEASARLRPPNVTVKRNVQSTSVSGARPVAGSVVRVSPMNMPRANAVARQIFSNNGSGQRGSLGSNVAMHIRSENTPPSGSRPRLSHPAPLPLAPAQTFHPDWKLPPSRPIIRISLHETGIVISWTLEDTGSRFAECVTYQIYAYQETINEPSTDSWRHVGDVKAMLLPMAVTLNQFQENQRYFFAVRGVDAHERYGVFSLPKTW